MKTNQIIFWLTTGIIGLMMVFSAYLYLTSPQLAEAFIHLGFPSYFRIELAIAKILGAIILLIPQIPARIKEWAYAGFAITFVSAIVAHIALNDSFIPPLVFLVLLGVSNFYYHRLNAPKTAN
jgi:hypothetical protein